LYSIGSNGLPVATKAVPSVHLIASYGVTSILECGFDNGRMIGFSWALFIVSIAYYVKLPA